ncbi:unnamed protein product [Effrenium voratum]|nr:unnamed protein product [Effrenium voratum]
MSRSALLWILPVAQGLYPQLAVTPPEGSVPNVLESSLLFGWNQGLLATHLGSTALFGFESKDTSELNVYKIAPGSGSPDLGPGLVVANNSDSRAMVTMNDSTALVCWRNDPGALWQCRAIFVGAELSSSNAIDLGSFQATLGLGAVTLAEGLGAIACHDRENVELSCTVLALVGSELQSRGQVNLANVDTDERHVEPIGGSKSLVVSGIPARA